MTRRRALAIVVLLWAAIYLPGLGSTEIKGEEGRRILPAVTMLETGNWVVPYVGGKPYLRKPPLVNWAIASSFALTGVRNEWSARLPSALAVLLLAATLVLVSSGRGWWTADEGLTAAILCMTSFGLLSKARLAGAEIEGIYVPLVGIGIVFWMASWSQQRSPWLTWTIPFFFFALAALAKAPLHLLFFYVISATFLWRANALREFFALPHFAGLLLMAGVVAIWIVPYLRAAETGGAMQTWSDQFAGRVTGNAFDWRTPPTNIGRALIDQLPWLLFAPLLFRPTRPPAAPHLEPRDIPVERFGDAIRPVALAMALCFFLVLLVPGVLPRYLLPLGIPFGVLVAYQLHHAADPGRPLRIWLRMNTMCAALLIVVALAAPLVAAMPLDAKEITSAFRTLDFRRALPAALVSTIVLAVCAAVIARRSSGLRPVGLAISTGALFGAAALLYGIAAVRWINASDNVRPLAAAIDQAVTRATERSATATRSPRLVLFDPEWEPAIFYLRTPHSYAANIKDIPANAEFVLSRAKNEREREEQLEKFGRRRPDLEWAETIRGRDGEELLLLRRREAISKDAP